MSNKNYPDSGYSEISLTLGSVSQSAVTGDLTNYTATVRVSSDVDASVIVQYSTDGSSDWTNAASYTVTASVPDDHSILSGYYLRVLLSPTSASGTASVYIHGVSSTPSYCTADDVARILGLRSSTGAVTTFSEAYSPITRTMVNDLILRNEDLIDELTNHAWRSVLVNNEYHDFLRPAFYGPQGRYTQNKMVSLGHRSIRSFTSGTHKIEVWDGSTWKDYVLTANSLTEGRGNDYWIDYTNGMIYFIGQTPAFNENAVRVTYEYGESSVPKQVNKLCAMMTVIDIAMQADYIDAFPEGSQAPLGVKSKIDLWQRQVDDILGHLKEIPKGDF